MSGHNKVYGICENKCMVEIEPKSKTQLHKSFTYVVNSDASLEYWLTNKASGTSSGGNDFTSVLIRKGTWNFTGNTVALDTIGTLYVEGETGSLLKFTNTNEPLRYSSLDLMAKRSMYNVSVSSTFNQSAATNVMDIVFRNCTNLTACKATITSEDSNSSGYHNVFVFYYCTNLIDCIGEGTGIKNVDVQTFTYCEKLIRCISKAHANNAKTYVNIQYAAGFWNCKYLDMCLATATTNSEHTQPNGYGFSDCTVVHKCKADSHCSEVVFYNCYASHSKTVTYACANTAEGGFNDPTNPSA